MVNDEIVKLLTAKPVSRDAHLVILKQFNRMLWKLAKRCTQIRRGFPFQTDDYYQEGAIALMEAAERFDPTRETKFSSWAFGWVWGRLRAGRCGMIRIPVHWWWEKDKGDEISRLSPRRLDSRIPGEGKHAELNIPDPAEEREHERQSQIDTVERVQMLANKCRDEKRRKVIWEFFGLGKPSEVGGIRITDMAVDAGVSKERMAQLLRSGVQDMLDILWFEGRIREPTECPAFNGYRVKPNPASDLPCHTEDTAENPTGEREKCQPNKSY